MLGSRAQLVTIAAGLLVLTVVQVAMAGSSPRATSSAKLKSEVSKLKARVAALEAKPDQVGQTPTIPPIPTTLPPSGSAGGELAGTYPNPTIGTAAGLDLASSTDPNAGINFGADTSLFRGAANQLRSDDNVEFNGSLDVGSSVFLGNGAFVNPGIMLLGEASGVILNLPNHSTLFARDNGSGKTQLVVKWPDGAETILGTQP